MDVYAAVDIRDGKSVRLTQGDFGRETVYFEEPVEAAQHWLDHGADWLHVVDLDGARTGRRVNAAAVTTILAAAGDTPVQVAGGLRSGGAAEAMIRAGAARIVLGTAAVHDPSLVKAASAALPGRVAVGIDARNGEVMTDGWERGSGRPATEVAAAAVAAGAAAIIYTDIATDGTLTHPNFDGLAEMVGQFGTELDVIASGGVSDLADIARLRDGGAAGAIIGRALYTGSVRLDAAVRVAHGE